MRRPKPRPACSFAQSDQSVRYSVIASPTPAHNAGDQVGFDQVELMHWSVQAAYTIRSISVYRGGGSFILLRDSIIRR